MLHVLNTLLRLTLFGALMQICQAAILFAAPDRPPLKIGAILPLSGEFAEMGQEIRRGIELAMDRHAAEINIHVDFQDMQSMNLKSAAAAAQKVLNLERASVGFCVFMDDAEVVGPIFNKAGVPLLVLWDSSRQLRHMGRYVFSNGFSTEFAGEAAARFSYEKLRLRRMALVQHESSWGDIIAKAFQDEYEKLGGRLAFAARLPLTGADYRTAALQITNRKADGVYFPLSLDGASFLKELQLRRAKLALVSADTMVVPGTIEAAGAAAEGVIFTSVYSEKAEELKARYGSRYAKEPIDSTWVSFGFDGIERVAEAVRVQSSQGGSLAAAFSKIYGESRSAERKIKFFQVRGGRPFPLPD
jgi:branched-chain amino acid transport system substrate-binding protein